MLEISKVSFPGLGIGEFEVNSSFFGTSIAWYAVIITLGMIAAVTYIILMSKKIGITSEDVLDFALFVIPIGIVGARLYYVLSEIEHYNSFWDVINIRAGGLAIYGGIIAGGLTVLAVCYFKKINFLAFADYVAPGVLLAQGIGRWGNFMNGEAFGYECDWFCRMGLDNWLTGHQYMEVHPTFLYESLWNLLGVLLVFLFDRYLHKKYDGQLFFMIFAWYGFGRFFIEGLRTDSLYFNLFGKAFRTSQVLAAILCLVFTGLLIYFAIRKPTKPFYHKEAKPADGKPTGKKPGNTKNQTVVKSSSASNKKNDKNKENTIKETKLDSVTPEVKKESSELDEAKKEDNTEKVEKEDDK